MIAEIYKASNGNYFIFIGEYVIKCLIPDSILWKNHKGYYEVMKLDKHTMADQKKEVMLISEKLEKPNPVIQAVEKHIVPFMEFLNMFEIAPRN